MSLGNGHEGNGYGALPPIQFEELVGRDTSDSSNRRYHKPPSEYDHEIWHLGWTDGRHGQPQGDNVAIIGARARLAWQERAAAADAEIGQKRALVRNHEGVLFRLRKRLDLIADDHLSLLKERSDNPQSYSLSLWLIYSLAALVLIAADLPLSLKLVAMGYGVTTETQSEINRLSVDDLLKNPYVLVEFWEAMLLALGIALSGVLIKYLLDSFVYREEQKTATRVFTYTLTGILVLFLGTTVYLGIFRASVQRQKHVAELTEQQDGLRRLRGANADPEIDKEIARIEAEKQAELSESNGSVRTVSFIALTLLFPISGGICFSVGWRKLIRCLRFRSVEKALKRAESDYRGEELLSEQARGALASLEAKRARENAAYASGDAYADMLVGIYLHGYERGRNVPETVDAGASLYERCEKAVNKLLAGKLRGRYWEVNPPNARGVK